MSSIKRDLRAWFGYGLGVILGSTLFSSVGTAAEEVVKHPLKIQTPPEEKTEIEEEEEVLEDVMEDVEERAVEEEKKLGF